MPLHFLAQIDCTELPRIDARMPDTGMLFFFAREDEEKIWGMPNEWRWIGYQAVPHDDCRVIYVAEVARDQPIRCPPSDLPPINENWGTYNKVLPNKPGPSVHLAWPLFATTFDTWPDSSAFDPPMEDDRDKYDPHVEAARIQSFFAATGFARRQEKPAEWQQDVFPAKPFRRPEIVPVGSMMYELAYAVADRALRHLRFHSSPDGEAIVDAARNWLEMGREIGAEQIVPTDKMAEFGAWLDRFSQPTAADYDPPPRTEQQARQEWFENRPLTSKIRCDMPNIFSFAIRRVISRLANSPAAAMVPADIYDAVASYFLPFDNRLALTHQMLGYAPATQEAMRLGSDALCLLQLGSDPGVEMMFGDVGEASFWITSEDLAQGRFEEAWVTLQGH